MTSYYTPEYNFAVEKIRGQWCMVAKTEDSVESSDPEVIAAVAHHAGENMRRFQESHDAQR